MSIKLACFSIVGISLLFGCGSDSGSSNDATATGTGTETVSAEVTSLKDLSLTGVLAITLPDSVKGNGTAAGLRLAGQKSFEACQLRDQMREALSNIAMVKSQFCFIENDPNITFGKKYNIDLSSMSGGPGGDPGSGPGGDPGSGPGGSGPGGSGPGDFTPPGLRLQDFEMPTSIQVWIDNSTAGKITVYMCQDKVLSQMISVSGAKEGVSKGTVVMKQSLSGMTFHRAMNFDNKYTDADRTSVTIKELIDVSQGDQSFSARRLLSLSLADTGVSKALASFTGNMGQGESSFASIGAFDEDFGSVIAKGSMTFESQPMTFSNESFFDGKSYVVDPADYPEAFGDDGKVALKPESVPGFLGADFTPDEFPADAWDCTGTEDIELGTESSGDADMSACTESWAELSQESCYDAAFAQGEAVQIDESKQVDAEEFEGFSEEDLAAELK
ncbi:hypothetical protein [Oligoflexus tunisiensis]|uniref:hypothetical protein n=1 Tax=Oligoflexus tunisiensis TaxID=708132 RepID=UPI00159F0E1C|nr:hypothetical protein [Oligoflexus tunisiensis]